MPAAYTEEQLAELTEEERAGLLDPDLLDDAPDEGGASSDDVTIETLSDAELEDGAAPPAKPEERKTDPDPEAAKAEPADKPAPDQAKPAQPDAAPAPAADAAPKRPAGPVYTAPADIDQQITATRQEQRALAAKFDAGDLSGAEYEEQRQALEDKVVDLRFTKERAGQSYDARKHDFIQSTVPDFLTAHPQFVPPNPEVEGDTGNKAFQLLDTQVRILQATKYKTDPFHPDLIGEAYEALVGAASDLTGHAPAAKPGKKETVPKANGEREIPPSLGTLPAAGEDNLSDGGRFAHLDRLNGEAFENALAALSPADRDRYLNS
jgi:hypothetical protein